MRSRSGRWWSRSRAVALAAGAVLLGASCAERPTEPERPPPAERLEGTWRWVSSESVSTQEVHTPTSAGFEAELVFVADGDREGRFVYRRTGAPDVEGGFNIGFEDEPGNDFIVLDESIDFLESHAWIAVGQDSLWLGSFLEDGFNSRYVRVP